MSAWDVISQGVGDESHASQGQPQSMVATDIESIGRQNAYP